MAKRPRDPAQLAKQVFDIAIGEAEDTVESGLSDHVWSIEQMCGLLPKVASSTRQMEKIWSLRLWVKSFERVTGTQLLTCIVHLYVVAQSQQPLVNVEIDHRPQKGYRRIASGMSRQAPRFGAYAPRAQSLFFSPPTK